MGVSTCLWPELQNISNDQVKVAAKNINAKFFASGLLIKRAGSNNLVHFVWYCIVTND